MSAPVRPHHTPEMTAAALQAHLAVCPKWLCRLTAPSACGWLTALCHILLADNLPPQAACHDSLPSASFFYRHPAIKHLFASSVNYSKASRLITYRNTFLSLLSHTAGISILTRIHSCQKAIFKHTLGTFMRGRIKAPMFVSQASGRRLCQGRLCWAGTPDRIAPVTHRDAPESDFRKVLGETAINAPKGLYGAVTGPRGQSRKTGIKQAFTDLF